VADKRESLLGKIRRLFSSYPGDPGVHPQAFAGMGQGRKGQAGVASGTFAFQSIPDKFYFLLFGAIRAHLRVSLQGRAELVVVRAVSGTVGTGVLAEIKRSAPVSWLGSGPWVRAYGEVVDGVAYRCATWAHPFSDLADWFKSNDLWRQLRQQDEAYTLQVDGVELADLLIDSYLRFRPSPEFDVTDPFVRRLIWQALRDVRQAREYFGRSQPRLYLTSYTTYLEHGIPARVALHQGVDVWSFGNLNSIGKRLSLSDSYHTQDFSAYRKTFEALDHQTERLQEARKQLENRLAGGIDAATSYMRQSAYGQTAVELPPGLDGAVVIFLHDFYDSPHVYPELVFHDFWRWVCFTIEVLQKTGARFFLKPHPNQIAMSDEALGRLRASYPDLQWLPVGANNVRLARAGIACGITVYGTVAHELAYLGVPSIGCARHPHFTFDFCRTARTPMEYERMLKTYQEMPLSKAEMERQALVFYYMHNLHMADGERELQMAYVAFWKSCHVADASDDDVMHGFRNLIDHPAFGRFVDAIACGDTESDVSFNPLSH
jgi:hypothetical protein